MNLQQGESTKIELGNKISKIKPGKGESKRKSKGDNVWNTVLSLTPHKKMKEI